VVGEKTFHPLLVRETAAHAAGHWNIFKVKMLIPISTGSGACG
jgi:hypothetical protein